MTYNDTDPGNAGVDLSGASDQIDPNCRDETNKLGHDIFDDLHNIESPGHLKRKKINK